MLTFGARFPSWQKCVGNMFYVRVTDGPPPAALVPTRACTPAPPRAQAHKTPEPQPRSAPSRAPRRRRRSRPRASGPPASPPHSRSPRRTSWYGDAVRLAPALRARVQPVHHRVGKRQPRARIRKHTGKLHGALVVAHHHHPGLHHRVIRHLAQLVALAAAQEDALEHGPKLLAGRTHPVAKVVIAIRDERAALDPRRNRLRATQLVHGQGLLVHHLAQVVHLLAVHQHARVVAARVLVKEARQLAAVAAARRPKVDALLLAGVDRVHRPPRCRRRAKRHQRVIHVRKYELDQGASSAASARAHGRSGQYDSAAPRLPGRDAAYQHVIHRPSSAAAGP